MCSQKQDFTSWFTVNDRVMKSWLSISLIDKYLVISPCLSMQLFVSYAKYDLANDNSLEKTQLPNQKYIWVNRMIIINVLAKSGVGKMYSARVLHGLIENRGRTNEVYDGIFVFRVNFLKKKNKFLWMEITAGREAGIAAC